MNPTIAIDKKQTQHTGYRHYRVGDLSLPSVTALLTKFENKEALFADWRAKNPGDRSATRGTKFHSEVERYYKKQVAADSPLFQVVHPILQKFIPSYIEEGVYWRNDLMFGFAGTADFLGYTNLSSFQVKETKEVLAGAVEPVLVDFKTWSKAKYPKGMCRDGSFYYPLMKYFLQLAAYRAAFAYSKGVLINNAFIIGCVEGSKMSYIYYLDGQSLNYYWYYIEQMVDAFFKQKPFDWEKMERDIAGSPDKLLGIRLEVR